MMALDLTGGLPLSREDMFDKAPDNPEMREAVNIWLQDDEGRFSLPRIGIEAVGAQWDRPTVLANMAFADGRVLIGSCEGVAHSPLDERGRPTRMGAGPISFRCVEPFARWTMSFEGDALYTSIEDQVRGVIPDGPRVDVEIQVEMTMVVPPWIQGQMGEEARARLENGRTEALLMGGERYEQLFTATGMLRVGMETTKFNGRGLRIHRQGVRDITEFRGHCWQSAVFPSGKAFGYIGFPDHDSGEQAYREGYVFDGERMYPAVIVEAPWMHSFEPFGAKVPLVLQSALGEHRIDGVTVSTTAVAPANFGADVVTKNAGGHLAVAVFLQQGTARYTWDGESTHGMVERSFPANRMRP